MRTIPAGELAKILADHKRWRETDGQEGSRANLGAANLSYANLGAADLRDAYLRGADLRYADLGGANLGAANLRYADLGGANLGAANLRYADLGGANLGAANLGDADLGGANLGAANLGDANLGGAEIPIVPNLHRRILDVLEAGKGKLNMQAWHTCETTHCRAGWAITLAGEAGKVLEERVGPAAAGAFITLASCPHLDRVPDFLATNEAALADIRACALEEESIAESEAARSLAVHTKGESHG